MKWPKFHPTPEQVRKYDYDDEADEFFYKGSDPVHRDCEFLERDCGFDYDEFH